MSKKITHEQMREHFKETFNINDVKYEDIRLITDYIVQQEELEKNLKQTEKLLELYREFYNHLNEKLGMVAFMVSDDVVSRTNEIIKQIKELENE